MSDLIVVNLQYIFRETRTTNIRRSTSSWRTLEGREVHGGLGKELCVFEGAQAWKECPAIIPGSRATTKSLTRRQNELEQELCVFNRHVCVCVGVCVYMHMHMHIHMHMHMHMNIHMYVAYFD